MRDSDATIAAIATPPGRGGIGIVRVSGGAARAIAVALCGFEPDARMARLATFRDAQGAPIDRGLALLFRAPHSFTGEDVLELSAHGSPAVLDNLVRRACQLGARPARAGEFTERAFFNGRIDLAQAEAVADLIAARSGAQARAALRSLAGEFSRRVAAVVHAVVRLRVEIEAAIDFPDDASDAAHRGSVASLFAEVSGKLDALLASTRNGARLTDGLRAVIAGEPNVGKSSLLNALAGDERAIVTAIPGTTRDVLSESILFDGVDLTLVDTAGLREPTDAIEGEGIRRARAELERADVVVWVVDSTNAAAVTGCPIEVRPSAIRVVVINKIDLTGSSPRRDKTDGVARFALSARTGAGVDLLRRELRDIAIGSEGDGAFSARSRHVVALESAWAQVGRARAALPTAGPELVAEDLRGVQRTLGAITGEFTSDDLLGAIFSTFCIGK